MKEVYSIEFNGNHYQSVFPSKESHLSQTHTSVTSALKYMHSDCGIDLNLIETP